jgi:hypothetical protein
MSFTGHENHSIDLDTASKWTKNYRQTVSEGSTIAEYFGKEAIAAILNQTNCVGIRLYYSLDDSGVKHLIVVGVNSDENDLYEGLLAERALTCPQRCSAINPLNSNM